MIFKIIFWVAVALVFHSYVVYPAIMVVLGRLLPRYRPPGEQAFEPSVAVIVAAFNEQRHIEDRIRNILGQDYEPQQLKIYAGSDGSTDATVELATAFESPQVRVFPFQERRGKSSVLNDLVAAANEEIVIFTDANTEFSRNAIRELVKPFSDPDVGAVSGILKLRDPVAGDNRDSSYWRVENLLKLGESAAGGILGANGAIYAIRRELYQPLQPDTIVDDFTVVMNVSAQGYRTIFWPEAVASEDVPELIEDEFRRRVRIGVGNFQAFFRHPEYFFKASWLRRFTYTSHKILRWFTPHLLFIALLASSIVSSEPLYGVLLALQLAVYSLLGIALLLKPKVPMPRLLSAPLFIFALNVAFVVAFLRYVSGNVSGQWKRTERA